MVKTVLLILLAAIVLLLIVAATKPDNFRIARSVRIQAPTERVHGLISDLRQFNRWNPWQKKDPAIQGQYSAATAGVGASYAWQSDKVGQGRMTLTEVQPPTRVAMQLEFIKPMATVSNAEFTLRAEGDGTVVNWAMFGPTPFVSKLMQVFFSMDRMVGPDFESGLADLKALAEKA